MKEGIITFHRAVNYGAALQAYALAKVIADKDNEVKIIDYRCPKIENTVSPFCGFKENPKNIKNNIKQMIFRLIKNKAFRDFYKKNIKMTKPIYDESGLRKLNDEMDCFIAGSDQIWNYGCTNSDTAYFLDFVEDASKKYSYAASFGFEKPLKNDPFNYHELLKDFNQISMRENSGSKLIKDFASRDSYVHVDPTLLLKKEEWLPIVSKRPIKERYIFVYYIREPKDMLKYAEELGRKKGCKVIDPKKSIEFLRKCSPEDFLSWIYNAEYVVTNSFHGTVFSIIFQKKFVVELKNKNSKNNRSEELLNLVGLDDREMDINNMNKIDNDFDSEKIISIIDEERKKAFSYLDLMIS